MSLDVAESGCGVDAVAVPPWRWVGPVAEFVCHWCAGIFSAPMSRSIKANWFCGNECRTQCTTARRRLYDRRRNATPHRRSYKRAWCNQPERVDARREYARRWRAEQRAKADPWWCAAPECGPTLPCVSLDLSFSPAPKWPLDLRNMRGVHGALTTLFDGALGLRHRPRWPTFAPRLHGPDTLRVIVWDRAALDLCGSAYEGALYDRPTRFRVEDAVEVAAPVVTRCGRQRVRLTAITPVVISKNANAGPETRPSADAIRHSLSQEFLARLGLDIAEHRDRVMVEVISSRTEAVRCDLRGKYPPFHGWTGDVELEVNAPALWLLLAAEKVGMGSRTGFGLGQVVVTELARTEAAA